eukprot:2205916-Prymnesium_polylepis.1
MPCMYLRATSRASNGALRNVANARWWLGNKWESKRTGGRSMGGAGCSNVRRCRGVRALEGRRRARVRAGGPPSPELLLAVVPKRRRRRERVGGRGRGREAGRGRA